MWQSTSSSGWEYFIMWEDLGSSPMYAICVVFNFNVLIICMCVLSKNIVIELY